MPLAALLAVPILAAPAPVADWTPATVASGPAQPAALVLAADGTALAAWRRAGAARLSLRPPGGPWQAPCAPAGAAEPAGLAAYGRSRILVAALAGRRLSVAFGDTGACRPGRWQRVARPSHRVVHPSLAANRRGDAALAWWEDRGARADRVRVSLRRPGGGFGRPRRLGRGAVRHLALAVGARGDVLVAWEARGRVRARLRRPGRRRFEPAETIRSASTLGARPQVAIGADGRAFVAWSAQRRSEGGDAGPVLVEAALRPRAAGRFRPAQRLESFEGRVLDDGFLRIAADGAGNATAAWTAAGGVRAATTGPDGRFGPVQTLAGGNLSLADLAVAPDGAAVVLWHGAPDAPGPLQAAHRGPGEAFGPPETVTGAGTGALAAFSPAGGPVALWAAPDALRSADRG